MYCQFISVFQSTEISSIRGQILQYYLADLLVDLILNKSEKLHVSLEFFKVSTCCETLL